MLPHREQFIKMIKHFLENREMAAADFGIQCLNDTRFVFELEKGRTPRLDTVERVLKFMSDYEAANSHDSNVANRSEQ